MLLRQFLEQHAFIQQQTEESEGCIPGNSHKIIMKYESEHDDGREQQQYHQQKIKPTIMSSPVSSVKEEPDLNDASFMRANTLGAIGRLEARDMSPVATEVGILLRNRCSVPESQISLEERDLNERMMYGILNLEHALRDRNDNNDDGGAVYLLYRKLVLTPSNVQALLHMMDCKVRRGDVRCVAMYILKIWMNDTTIYRVRFPDGSTFSRKCLEVLCQGLEDDLEDFRACQNNHNHNGGRQTTSSRRCPPPLHFSDCRCCVRWTLISYLLTLARDEPGPLTDVLSHYNWKAILEEPNFAPNTHARTLHTDARAHQADCQMFYVLHHAAVRALERDKGHANALHLLQHLGTCHDLFRSVVRRIVKDDVWSTVPSAGGDQDDDNTVETTPSSGVSCESECHGSVNTTSNTVSELTELCQFLMDFLHCLSPLPNDHETDHLLDVALVKLRHAYSRGDSQASAPSVQNCLDYVQDQWPQLQQQSDVERWTRLVQNYHLNNPPMRVDAQARKVVVRKLQHKIRQNWVGSSKVEPTSSFRKPTCPRGRGRPSAPNAASSSTAGRTAKSNIGRRNTRNNVNIDWEAIATSTKSVCSTTCCQTEAHAGFDE